MVFNYTALTTKNFLPNEVPVFLEDWRTLNCPMCGLRRWMEMSSHSLCLSIHLCLFFCSFCCSKCATIDLSLLWLHAGYFKVKLHWEMSCPYKLNPSEKTAMSSLMYCGTFSFLEDWKFYGQLVMLVSGRKNWLNLSKQLVGWKELVDFVAMWPFVDLALRPRRHSQTQYVWQARLRWCMGFVPVFRCRDFFLILPVPLLGQSFPCHRIPSWHLLCSGRPPLNSHLPI